VVYHLAVQRAGPRGAGAVRLSKYSIQQTIRRS
jgi:hypothetical protein